MTSSQIYSLENPKIWIVIQRKEIKRGCLLFVLQGYRGWLKWDPGGVGTGLEIEQGWSAPQSKLSCFVFPFCLLFRGLSAPHKYRSYASQTPRSINHLKDELIISELLRHAEGQADKFSWHSGELFLWLGYQVDDKFRSLQGSRWRDRSFLFEQEQSLINTKPPVEKSSSVKRDPYLPI